MSIENSLNCEVIENNDQGRPGRSIQKPLKRRASIKCDPTQNTGARNEALLDEDRFAGSPSTVLKGLGADESGSETDLNKKPSKTSIVLDALRAPSGATLVDLKTIAGWQEHSVRGFLSGTVRKKLGLTVIAVASTDGSKHYRIVSADDRQGVL